MRRTYNKAKNNKHENGHAGNGLIPNSYRFISSCIKTVSSNVRSARAGGDSDEHHKDQVLWSCFDRLELSPYSFKHVLLIGYSNGFQVLDVDDASNFGELVSRRDDPVTFLQIQPIPEQSKGHEGFRTSHPLLLVVASEETRNPGPLQNERDSYTDPLTGNSVHSPTSVRFYSLRSHNYVHVLRFRSTVYMVRCSPRIVAVGLASQIYCFDALTLESKFSVLTYPVPQLGGQGISGINIGYGPMAVGPRWLAYASNNPLLSNTGRLSPQSLSPSPGVSPSTSPSSGSLVARYAMESSKQLAAGLINLGDMGYKTLSKYCHELLPDGSSSPGSSNSSWKGVRVAAHSTETDNAGMVVIRDFVSRAIISQFRAHASPLSALCFDPSGTLLVTASVHGNNINIFRILPSSSIGSGTQSFDWSSSHVHLYKLHRGITSAVIQDICFSHYSQWVAIVSSRGTCHIFVLSPFGGETGVQSHNSKSWEPMLSAFVSVPWWSTSSFMINPSFSPPAPAAVTLSVVSRIKNNNFGWLNTVGSASSSASGKVSVPPGAIAAVFHSSVHQNLEPAVLDAKALEHLLVYTPSGHVIQYELLPSLGGEQGESSLRNGKASPVHMQEEDLRVKFEPIQWWDVCRRADWPEREEFIGEITCSRHDATETVMDASDEEDNNSVEKNLIKPHERSHWYLSNAEVQVRSGRVPIWRKSKICFYVMVPRQCEELNNICEDYVGGEIDIETIPAHEIEIRQEDLRPVLDGSDGIRSGLIDGRIFDAGRCSALSSNSDGVDENFPEDPRISDAKMVFSSFRTASSNAGSSRVLAGMQEKMETREPYLNLEATGKCNDGVNRRGSILDQRSSAGVNPVSSSGQHATILLSLDEDYVQNSPSSDRASILLQGTVDGVRSSESVETSNASNMSSNLSESSINIVDKGLVHEDVDDLLDFGHNFQEESYKASSDKKESRLAEVTWVDTSGSLRGKKKSEEDDDSDDTLGGVFELSEECC